MASKHPANKEMKKKKKTQEVNIFMEEDEYETMKVFDEIKKKDNGSKIHSITQKEHNSYPKKRKSDELPEILTPSAVTEPVPRKKKKTQTFSDSTTSNQTTLLAEKSSTPCSDPHQNTGTNDAGTTNKRISVKSEPQEISLSLAKKKRDSNKKINSINSIKSSLMDLIKNKAPEELISNKAAKLRQASLNLKKSVMRENEFDAFVQNATDIQPATDPANKSDQEEEEEEDEQEDPMESIASSSSANVKYDDNVLDLLEAENITLSSSGRIRNVNTKTRTRGKVQGLFKKISEADASDHFGYKQLAQSPMNEAINMYDLPTVDSMSPYRREGVVTTIVQEPKPKPDLSEENIKAERDRQESLLDSVLGNNDPESIRNTTQDPGLLTDTWFFGYEKLFKSILWKPAVHPVKLAEQGTQRQVGLHDRFELLCRCGMRHPVHLEGFEHVHFDEQSQVDGVLLPLGTVRMGVRHHVAEQVRVSTVRVSGKRRSRGLPIVVKNHQRTQK